MELLGDAFALSEPCVVELKGRGPTVARFLLGRADAVEAAREHVRADAWRMPLEPLPFGAMTHGLADRSRLGRRKPGSSGVV